MTNDHVCREVYRELPEDPPGCPLCLARERLGRLVREELPVCKEWNAHILEWYLRVNVRAIMRMYHEFRAV